VCDTQAAELFAVAHRSQLEYATDDATMSENNSDNTAEKKSSQSNVHLSESH